MLWIDDETVILDYVRHVLPRNGFDVTVASSGAIGLALARKGGFDLIVLDLRMPDMSGLEVLRQLRAADCDIPVVIFTAYLSEESAHEAGCWGAVRYLKKPLMGDALMNALRAATKVPLVKTRAVTRSSKVIASAGLLPEVLLLVQRIGAERRTNTALSDATVRELVGCLVDASVDATTIALPQFAALARIVRLVLQARDLPGNGDFFRQVLQLSDQAIAFDLARVDPMVIRAIERFAEPISLQEEALADTFDLHPSTVGRSLKVATGFGYRDLRWAALIRPSIASLARTLQPIRHIAIQCGYHNHDRLSQFDRDFEHVLGVTPSDFRRLASRLPPRSRKN
ncbi:MAG TPA: response regulator transcription factor [Vicinamibacterales bacterium]|nr:response regulator transcription factor [Vicinamibacterales bacterium]